VPPQEHLERYADVLVNWALGGGDGIRPGEVVHVTAPESARPLYIESCRAIWQAGGHVIGDYRPDDDDERNWERVFYDTASDEQLDFFAERYERGFVDEVDHGLYVMCWNDPHSLSEVDPARMMRRRVSQSPFREWLDAKEDAAEYTWTIGLYPTPGMAAEARLSIEEYWEQIVVACFLDDPDPVQRWREVTAQVEAQCAALNAMPIERLHVEGEDIDLWLTLGEKRAWKGGGGVNVPSFEVFTSPDWRGTEGRIRFSEPLYIYGSLIKGVELEFRDGGVVEARAEENLALLTEMIATEGADRVGEFSLTDGRLSRITKFMANTLYDENVGGPFGNTHLALGRSLRLCYDGDPDTVPDEEWERLGFNDSVVHTDIVSTTDRTVTAVLTDGTERVIYASGKFLDS